MVLIFVTIILFAIEIPNSHSIHASIGNYSGYGVSTEGCGITEFSDQYQNDCFEWNGKLEFKPIGIFDKDLILNHKDESHLAVPWNALIVMFDLADNNDTENVFTCTGSLITKSWVISAAHCFSNDALNATIYLGLSANYQYDLPQLINWPYRYEIKRKINHPDYMSKKFKEIGLDFDLILIELTKDVFIGTDANAVTIQTICLPKPFIINFDPEYALIAGWDMTREDKLANKSFANPLKMGWRMLLPLGEFRLDESGATLYSQYVSGELVSCDGDSGGPVWQIIGKQAVLIGVQGGRYIETKEEILCGNNNSIYVAARISRNIAWILTIIRS